MTRTATAGDVRDYHRHPGVWGGKSRAASTQGVHAVTDMEVNGARTSACGLKGRYLVDERLTAGVDLFIKVPVGHRCAACHTRWLEMAGES